MGQLSLILTRRHRITDERESEVNKAIGIGIGFSAINGAEIVMNLAKQLQIPKAVPQSYIGNTKGVET